MFNLIGETEEVSQKYIGGDFESHYDEQIIATFDTKEDAEQYIEDSRLSKRVHVSFGADKVFRQNSLLSGCVGARVEEHQEHYIPPHNPSL